MPQAGRWAGVVVLGLLLTPGLAHAGERSCLGTGKKQLIIDNTFVGVVNPIGVENQLKAALCFPLTQLPGILHDYDGLELGLYNYLSPVYLQQGAYVSVVPLSFLELRAAVAGLVIWPFPLDATGYFPLASYDAPTTDAALPAASAQTAGGLDVTLTANLQGQVELAGPYSVVITNSFSGDFWFIGNGAYYVNQRQDATLARSDWVVKNNASLLIETRLRPGVSLRTGLNDDLTWVPGSGHVGNILSFFASLPIRRENASLHDLEPFVRLGTYTHHPYRLGLMLFVGLSLTWAHPR